MKQKDLWNLDIFFDTDIRLISSKLTSGLSLQNNAEEDDKADPSEAQNTDYHTHIYIQHIHTQSTKHTYVQGQGQKQLEETRD